MNSPMIICLIDNGIDGLHGIQLALSMYEFGWKPLSVDGSMIQTFWKCLIMNTDSYATKYPQP